MKKNILIIMMMFFGTQLFAQAPVITKGEFIGVWQINSPRVGNGYAESFSFFKDGTFIYQYDPSDDTRNITQLKGRYQLDDERLIVAVTHRIERLGGKIMAGGVGTDEYLFVFDNDKLKNVAEVSPKPLDPFFISKVHKVSGKIDCLINNRHYYKVSTDPNAIKQQ
jgi:hypothetical protein